MQRTVIPARLVILDFEFTKGMDWVDKIGHLNWITHHEQKGLPFVAGQFCRGATPVWDVMKKPTCRQALKKATRLELFFLEL